MQVGWQHILIWVPSISATIALIALIYNYRRNPRKNLCYEVLFNQALVSVDNKVKNRVKVLFDDVEVPEVHIVIIRFTNIGNTPITAKDFVTPITINLSKEAKILHSGFGETSPKGIPVSAAIEGNNYLLQSAVLNPGYSVPVIIYATKVFSIEVSGIIEGVKIISRRNLSLNPFRYKNRPGFFITLLVLSIITASLILMGYRKLSVYPLGLIFLQLMYLLIQAGDFFSTVFADGVVDKLKKLGVFQEK